MSITKNSSSIILFFFIKHSSLKIIIVLQLASLFQAHLALYCFANHQVSISLRLMYRTRYLALLCHGENHPEVALIDVSSPLTISC
jgi:hypothetical protein